MSLSGTLAVTRHRHRVEGERERGTGVGVGVEGPLGDRFKSK